ncbi:glucokinase [Pedobacter sp. UYP30]|uniref:ROK family protein n=1 Tax=Pedobacter sp. UYP30 TaxID=1756400 RepID=UPI003398E023
MEKHVALGIDIGGTHITAALIDLDNRHLIQDSIRRQPVNSKGKKEEIINSWCKVINETFKDVPNQLRYIGIAIPGPFDYEEGISLIKDQDKFRALYDVNIKNELSACLGIPKDHFYFINDAASFLQGEVYAGAARDKSRVFGLTLGTGLGSAHCIDFKSVDADLWNEGFLDGIAEDYFSTRWFLKRYKEANGRELTGVKELVALLDSDESAQQIFDEFGENLANFLVPIIELHQTDTVVIGGNISKAFFAFSQKLMETLKQKHVAVEIAVSKLNELSAIIGAASCCEEYYISK